MQYGVRTLHIYGLLKVLYIKYLSDVMYPDAEKIILVMDNLNTHNHAS